jgi:hypothetical protein
MLIVMVLSSAVFGYWVLWSREWIKQRHEAIESGEIIDFTGDTARPAAPSGLWLLGESGVSSVVVPFGSRKETILKAKNLFPEATITGYGI